MKKLFGILAILIVFTSCNTTQEVRSCPMWNQKYTPQKPDSILVFDNKIIWY